MDRRTRGGAAAATMRPMTAEQLEEFYADEYPKLIKILGVIFEAKIDEAEEAAQKAMEDFIRRSKAGQAADRNPAAYVLKAAIHFFNRTILRRPPGRAPILSSGRRRPPEKRVEKPVCPTTPARPFPVRPEGDADPGRATPAPTRTTCSRPSRRT